MDESSAVELSSHCLSISRWSPINLCRNKNKPLGSLNVALQDVFQLCKGLQLQTHFVCKFSHI
jgi:hypothetical protein